MSIVPSLHDHELLSYAVDCEHRVITLRERDWAEDRLERTIVFIGVEGYHFRDDAFGTIIFALQEIPIEQLLATFGAEMAESFRVAGALGVWTQDLSSAPGVLAAKGVRAFTLESSRGMSG